MNRYDHTFSAICPSDGQTVIYHLTLKSKGVVMSEEIAVSCRFSEPQFHEAIADYLIVILGGKQTLRAMHQNVHITTKREASAPAAGG